MLTEVVPQKKKYLYLCQGWVPEKEIERIATNIIGAADMTPARKGRIDRYPYRGGGGVGYTGFFPLMESYLIIDAYFDQGITEILLSTCKPERLDEKKLIQVMEKEIGRVKIYD